MLSSATRFLNSLSRTSILAGSYFGLILVWAADFLTGSELASSIFYLPPIAIVAWHASLRSGQVIAVMSALAWLSADLGAGHIYSHLGIPFWNAFVRLCIFLVMAFLIGILRRKVDLLERLAATDSLTGLKNSRAFYDAICTETLRIVRFGGPLTIAYIDLDHFKLVNDRDGHRVGDQALRVVADTIRSVTRRLDEVARLGGDEFGLLLRQTGQSAAREAIDKIRRQLEVRMREHGWPITFSIGVATFESRSDKEQEIARVADDMIRVADELMYSVKREGKNNARFANHTLPG